MADIKFYKANALPASPTSAHDGIWFITDGASNYKHFIITGGVVKELTVTGAGGGSAEWGQITGTLADQTDLQNALNAKANDNAVVKLTGNQTIAGTKTFSSNVPVPLVPTANTHATSKKYVDDADANLQNQINDLELAVDAGLKTPEPIDCSSNPNYPASEAGDTYKVTVAGKIGGASGENVEVGDLIICTTDNAGGTQSGVGQHFFIVQTNIDQATETVVGIARLATQAETDAGTNDDTIVTPKKLQKKLDDFQNEQEQTSDGKYVRYDNNTQGLTNAQKSNARENIGAADDSTVVKTSGNQTVAGIKTFSAFPVTPSSAPTTDYQAANKKYVDDQIAAFALEWSTEDW